MSCNSITGKVVERKKPKPTKNQTQTKNLTCLISKVRQNFFLTEPFDALVYCSAVPAQ